MKKISIEEADKILAAHQPKEECCPFCGINLKDSHIPKSKIESLLKKWKDEYALLDTYQTWSDAAEYLKGLLES